MSDIGSALGSFGGAVSDIFGMFGSQKAGSAYKKAAAIAGENAQLAKEAEDIQRTQVGIQTFQAIGRQTTQTAGAGFNTREGSAGDLLRASASQAALAKQLVTTQGEINVRGYQQQQQAYQGQADAAAMAAKGQGAGGILNAVSGVAMLAGGWVICTELMRQRRLPARWWVKGSRIFAAYPKEVKEGYYVWAVPSVRHIRAHPYSLYSRFLCCIFNWRAENIAAHASVSGARRLVRGALVTALLWPLCYALGWARLKLNKTTDWERLYAEHRNL